MQDEKVLCSCILIMWILLAVIYFMQYYFIDEISNDPTDLYKELSSYEPAVYEVWDNE